MIAICGTAGWLTGGWLAGRLRNGGRADSNVLIAAACALPSAIAFPLMATGELSLALIGGFLFFGAMPYGGAAAAFQEITPNRMRGQMSAVYLFWLNLAGIGLGPTVVALVTERVYGGTGVSHALATVTGCGALLSALVLAAACAPYRRAMAVRAA